MAPKILVKFFSTYCTPDVVIVLSIPLPLVLLADDICFLFKLVLMGKASCIQ